VLGGKLTPHARAVVNEKQNLGEVGERGSG
jgi:hypothetical protein